VKQATPRGSRKALPLAFLLAISLPWAARSQQQPVLIQHANIVTVTNGTIRNGSILLRGGKIAQIGESLLVPGGAQVIEASGRYVTPGLIDCHSHIATDAINEGSIPISSMVGIEDVVDPDDVAIYRALAGGVTTANVLHGSANPIGGKCQVIKLRWGKPAAELIFEGAPPGIKFALGENPKRSNVQPGSRRVDLHPSTRLGVNDVIRQAFLDAKQYQSEWNQYERRKTAGETRLIPPRRDLELEALVEILEGKRLVHAHCYRADEILALLRLAEELGFRIQTLQHVLEGYKVAKEIAAHGAGASTFSDWWAYKVEAYDAIPYNAAIMTRKGVLVSINSDSPEEIRHLNQEAAKTMKWGGLSEDEALRLVTFNPAKQLKIEDRVGSIEEGKDADLVIWDGPPLSIFSKVLTTFVDGEVYFSRENDAETRVAEATERKALIEKEKERAKKKTSGAGREARRPTEAVQ
jgi:imidazolonepropionase-like amidohydrolase